jgi:hypothetical protein
MSLSWNWNLSLRSLRYSQISWCLSRAGPRSMQDIHAHPLWRRPSHQGIAVCHWRFSPSRQIALNLVSTPAVSLMNIMTSIPCLVLTRSSKTSWFHLVCGTWAANFSLSIACFLLSPTSALQGATLTSISSLQYVTCTLSWVEDPSAELGRAPTLDRHHEIWLYAWLRHEMSCMGRAPTLHRHHAHPLQTRHGQLDVWISSH